MRMRSPKKTVKGVKMKQLPIKKKKVAVEVIEAAIKVKKSPANKTAPKQKQLIQKGKATAKKPQTAIKKELDTTKIKAKLESKTAAKPKKVVAKKVQKPLSKPEDKKAPVKKPEVPEKKRIVKAKPRAKTVKISVITKPKKKVVINKKILIRPKQALITAKEIIFKPKGKIIKAKEGIVKRKDIVTKCKDVTTKSKDPTAKTKDVASKPKEMLIKAKDISKLKDTPIKSKDNAKSADNSPKPKEIPAKPKEIGVKPKPFKPIKIKEEPLDFPEDTSCDIFPLAEVKIEPTAVPIKTDKTSIKKVPAKSKVALMKQRALKSKELKKRKAENSHKLKLFSMWNGPKRHRVASLNALAKVQCLYENESGAHLLDQIELIKREPVEKKSKSGNKKPAHSPSPPPVIKTEPDSPPPTRTLRCVPGLRAVGKMWDMHDTTSSSEDEFDFFRQISTKPKPKPEPKKKPPKIVKAADTKPKPEKPKTEVKKKEPAEKKPVKRRKRAEIIMDLKDMVVRKRMASLNATAILAASYSVEKKPGLKSGTYDSDSETTSSEEIYSSDDENLKKYRLIDEADVKKEDVIELRTTPNKKVAVILNQDTDVTITGVYVNSTTRSTHHEGYCSIAGMQYRISATSHTQTAATAVSTETILQSSSASSTQENSNGETPPSKSYTPLDALSNMQPPAGSTSGGSHAVSLPPHHHLQPPTHMAPQHVLQHAEMSPLSRRHGCSSAFTAPGGPCGPQGHHHLPPPEHGYIQGYYQPAGPLITVPHGHSQPPLGKSVPLSEPPPSVSPPIQQPPPPSSAGDSSDSEVIITSVTTAKEASQQQQVPSSGQQQPQQQYRLNHYPPSHTSYPYYPQYYPAPPPASAYSHHDICYPAYSSPHKYMYRRYLPPPSGQYYRSSSPDMYSQPPNSATQQQVVTATSTASGSSYQQAPSGPPPTLIETYPSAPPTLVETYPPPPPHYYPSYGPAPPPPCYNHSPPSRTINYINPTYQSCPCPMQSCPKNVHTGPLAGDSKRSNISIAKESIPLPPVALALPLEPASATGPPSPARGSAGMPPPPSPAGATYQPPPPKQETPDPPDLNHAEKRRKARVGKAMVRNNIANNNTMLLMCHEPVQNTYLDNVKREVESPKETEAEIKKSPIIHTPEEINLSEKIKVISPTETCLKIESVEVDEEVCKEKEEILPCIPTVAENVKVKNMKRKLSVCKDAQKVEPSPPKKTKLEKNNGSYKDLIKKTLNVVKINNGKRKLIGESGRFRYRVKVKRPIKRKLCLSKEENNKRMKQSRPLTVSNHNHRQKFSNKIDHSNELSENMEPNTKCKKAVNLKTKTPTHAGSLISNVDRTIERVISGASDARTSKVQDASNALRTENCNDAIKEAAEVSAAVATKETVEDVPVKKSVPGKVTKTKAKVEPKVVCGKRKSKCKEVAQAITRLPRRSLQLRWSNGWMWEGPPFDGKVFLNSDEATVGRRCYPAMKHEEGDIIGLGDCVLLKAGQRKNELPFVAKIAALWENPEDGEMMMSLLWYYRPEHTEQGRLPSDQPDEVFASRHKDSNSVACIEDKCYVLTFNEYCRYRKNLRRLEEGIEDTGPCIPAPDPYPRVHRQPPTSVLTSPDMVFFCRRVYDFRQKRIVKNPS